MALLALLSPAKRLDFDSSVPDLPTSQARFAAQTQALAALACTWTPDDIAAKMKLSGSLAQLTFDRFQAFGTVQTQRPALFAFQGDVYRGLEAASLSFEQGLEAQDRLRILSGLYGLLRPLDLIEPYRLEMGTRVETPAGASLYAFWGRRIAEALNADAKDLGTSHLINLASQEYFKAVDLKALAVPLVHCHFKERRGGVPKVIAFNAKRARGLMARFLLTQGVETLAGLKDFEAEGYAYAPDLSDARNLTFLKEAHLKEA